MWLRNNSLTNNKIRPIHDRNLVLNWWKKGRPAPPPHIVKLNTLLYWADYINAKVLVETGSYLGDTLRFMQGRFEKIYSIEIAEIFAIPLQNEFKNDSSIEVVLGDSSSSLPIVIQKISTPTVFWLDAHHSGGDTEGFGYVPIFAEIDSISNNMKATHAIIIDDMIDFNGKDGYPNVTELELYLNKLNYITVNFNNMMQAIKV